MEEDEDDGVDENVDDDEDGNRFFSSAKITLS